MIRKFIVTVEEVVDPETPAPPPPTEPTDPAPHDPPVVVDPPPDPPPDTPVDPPPDHPTEEPPPAVVDPPPDPPAVVIEPPHPVDPPPAVEEPPVIPVKIIGSDPGPVDPVVTPPDLPPADPGRVPLVMTLAFAGSSLVFNEADGTELGDYVDPQGRFVQRCIRTTLPGSPFTVHFRPDRDSGREEVVVELGRVRGSANAAAANAASYTATITRGGTPLYTVAIPVHNWFGRWRWDPTPRPAVVTRASLTAAGLVPAFDSGLVAKCKPSRRFAYAGPMDNAGISKSMGAQGERPDIGLFTDWQAEYLATGEPGALATLLAQAEVGGSVPWNHRDEQTDAPVNFETSPTLYFSTVPLNGWVNVKNAATTWALDVPHYPSLGYVPFLLTGDPYHLETIQFQAAYAIGYQALPRSQSRPLLIGSGQTRGFAWGLREAVNAAVSTPADAPSWLLPKAYWSRVLDANLAWIRSDFINDTDPVSTRFRQCVDKYNDLANARIIIPWEEAYLDAVAAHVVRVGFTAWRDFLDWHVPARVALAGVGPDGGPSGWPRQWCEPYKIKPYHADRTTCTDYADMWEAHRVDPEMGVNPATFQPEVIPPWPQVGPMGSWGRLYTAWGGLAAARSVGVAGTDAAIGNLRAMTDDSLGRGKPWVYRWAFAATA